MQTLSNNIFFAQVESDIAAGRSVRFKIKGYSMYPLLRNNKDEVTLSPFDRDPEVMDIILFRYRGKHVLHRVIAIDGDRYIIKGDGICLSYEHCTRSDIIGVVTAIHKNRTLETTSKRLKLYIFFWHRLSFCRRYLLALLRRVYK